MIIYAQVNGEKVGVDVRRSDSVKDVLKLVAREKKLDAAQLRMFFRGQMLDPARDLYSCQIGSRTTVIVMVKRELKIEKDDSATEDEDSVEMIVEKESTAKVCAAAAEIAGSDEALVELQVDNAEEDLKRTNSNIPFSCHWRTTRVWKLPELKKCEKFIVKGWKDHFADIFLEESGERIADDDVLSKMTLLVTIGGVFQVVETKCVLENGVDLVLKPENMKDFIAGRCICAALMADESCCICQLGDNEEVLLICDECDKMYHTYCLNPPMEDIPDGNWYCPKCMAKLDTHSEEEREESIRKAKKEAAKKPSATCKRKWGGGLSCVGRETECETVGKHHIGAIPGVQVGQHWARRVHASEAGVHRPMVGGIHGDAKGCCYSICLSGGYEDDIDDGDEVLYTGSGGRDLSGNKRTNAQSCDQELKGANLALSKNCIAHKGCKDCMPNKACQSCLDRWREGSPIRVMRSYKNKSEYAPQAGYRYDGLYKVVDFWSEKGRAGFLVYRYRLRRDDPEPAPWTKEGKEKIEKFHLDDIPAEEEVLSSRRTSTQPLVPPPPRKRRRTAKVKIEISETEDEDDGEYENDDTETDASDDFVLKKPKDRTPVRGQKKTFTKSIELEKGDDYIEPTPFADNAMEVLKTLKPEPHEQRLFDVVSSAVKKGGSNFMDAMRDLLTCPNCLCVQQGAVVLPCTHHFCMKCLIGLQKAGHHVCPVCRKELPSVEELTESKLYKEIVGNIYFSYNMSHA